jgi:hypothetical protein
MGKKQMEAQAKQLCAIANDKNAHPRTRYKAGHQLGNLVRALKRNSKYA